MVGAAIAWLVQRLRGWYSDCVVGTAIVWLVQRLRGWYSDFVAINTELELSERGGSV